MEDLVSTISLKDIIIKLAYVSFLAVGLYWVCHGDSLSQYISGKTYFAEFSEPISELPTIVTYIYNSKNRSYKYMNDYKIYFTTLESINVESKESITENLTPLSHGDNTIDGIPFSLNLEEFYEGAYDNQIFKITPINFNYEIPLSTYALRYSFNQSAGQPKISMTLHSENNSIQPDWRFYDGDIINSALTWRRPRGYDFP